MGRKSFCSFENLKISFLRFKLFKYIFTKYAIKGTIKGQITHDFEDGNLLLGKYSSEIYTDDKVTVLFKEGSSTFCTPEARSVNMTLSNGFLM